MILHIERSFPSAITFHPGVTTCSQNNFTQFNLRISNVKNNNKNVRSKLITYTIPPKIDGKWPNVGKVGIVILHDDWDY
jgi:hypothetical protein